MHSSTALLLVLSLASGGRSYIPHDHPQHRVATGLCFVPPGAVRGRVHSKHHFLFHVPRPRNERAQVSGARPGPGDGQREPRAFRYVPLPT